MLGTGARPHLRLGDALDHAFVERLAHRAFRDFSRAAGSHTLGLLGGAGTSLVVAERGEELVGFAILRTSGSHAELAAIAVTERARGLGVGSALFHEVERHARRAQATTLNLCTAQANVEALSLFLRHGMRIERRLPRYYRHRVDACWLAKRL